MKGKIARWKLSKLYEHPQQAALFGDTSDVELAALVANIKKHGLRIPVEIMPDGTIICGHQRVRAARRLGWQEIDVIVRHDLVGAGEDAVKTLLIQDNLLRRQLSPLGKARCICTLMEIEKGRAATSFLLAGREDLKKRIAERMGLESRSVSRYLLVLRLPLALQKAFDAGQIGLVETGKVALLDMQVQTDIAKRVEAGEPVKLVVREHIRPKATQHVQPGNAFASFQRSLKLAVEDLGARVDKVNKQKIIRCMPDLQAGRTLIENLIAQVPEGYEPPEETIEGWHDRLREMLLSDEALAKKMAKKRLKKKKPL